MAHMNRKGPASHFKAGNPTRGKKPARGQIERRPNGDGEVEVWQVRSQRVTTQDRLGLVTHARQMVSEKRLRRERTVVEKPNRSDGFFTTEQAFIDGLYPQAWIIDGKARYGTPDRPGGRVL